jgi:hypothetical protein
MTDNRKHIQGVFETQGTIFEACSGYNILAGVTEGKMSLGMYALAGE